MQPHALPPTPSQVEHDLFGEVVPAPDIRPGQQIEFRGVLLRNAIVRNKPAADGLHSVPVVCIELRSTQPHAVTHTCYAEQPFTDATRKQAEALALRLTKGREITVCTAVLDMRLVFPHVSSISLP